MKKTLSILVIALAAIGIVSAQDLIKGTQNGGPAQLSGLSPDIFDGNFFQSDGWTFDTTSYSLTPSMTAFLKDDAKDGAPFFVNKTAYLGQPASKNDPRVM
jgi:hypothetical protein